MTIKIKRCCIIERSIDGVKRWVVTWWATDESIPTRIVCASKHAALTLAEVLEAPDVLWPRE